jgi:hypothetical protein
MQTIGDTSRCNARHVPFPARVTLRSGLLPRMRHGSDQHLRHPACEAFRL